MRPTNSPVFRLMLATELSPLSHTYNRFSFSLSAIPDGMTPRRDFASGLAMSLKVLFSFRELLSNSCTVSLLALLTYRQLPCCSSSFGALPPTDFPASAGA